MATVLLERIEAALPGIPVAPAFVDVPRPPRAARAVGARPRSGPARVLIVDDEPDIVASLVGLLEAELEGVRAEGAFSGEAALQVLANEAIDLVVSDFRMPGMDGLELLARVGERWPGVPTVLVSAYADEGLARQAEAAGDVRLFMPKPLAMDAFVQAVDQMLTQASS